ncbi:MAG: WecB/TagA/CpsF family glycosyltransferase [Hyphomicrobiales bacterium]
MDHPFPTREILGVKVAVCGRGDAIAFLLERLARRQETKVAFANANLLTTLADEPGGAKLLDGFLVFNDGIGLDIASKILFGNPFPDNVNGSDLTPALIAAVPKDTRIFLFGARPGVAEKAGAILAQRFGAAICGTCDGYEGARDPSRLLATISEARPDILLVALGNPRQEEWIAQNAGKLGVPIAMGIGALLDYLADTVPRAPRLVQRLRLEWLWRVALEPRRLGKRYTVDFIRFLWLVRKQKLMGGSGGSQRGGED